MHGAAPDGVPKPVGAGNLLPSLRLAPPTASEKGLGERAQIVPGNYAHASLSPPLLAPNQHKDRGACWSRQQKAPWRVPEGREEGPRRRLNGCGGKVIRKE